MHDFMKDFDHKTTDAIQRLHSKLSAVNASRMMNALEEYVSDPDQYVCHSRQSRRERKQMLTGDTLILPAGAEDLESDLEFLGERFPDITDRRAYHKNRIVACHCYHLHTLQQAYICIFWDVETIITLFYFPIPHVLVKGLL